MLARAGSSSSNCTGLRVFCWTTKARDLTRPPLTNHGFESGLRPPAQLAVDGKIEGRMIAQSPFSVEPKPYRPHLLRFSGRLAPTFRPAFHTRRSAKADRIVNVRLSFSSPPSSGRFENRKIYPAEEVGRFQFDPGKQLGSGRSKRRGAVTRQVTAAHPQSV
jgi:hypothetical protein